MTIKPAPVGFNGDHFTIMVIPAAAKPPTDIPPNTLVVPSGTTASMLASMENRATVKDQTGDVRIEVKRQVNVWRGDRRQREDMYYYINRDIDYYREVWTKTGTTEVTFDGGAERLGLHRSGKPRVPWQPPPPLHDIECEQHLEDQCRQCHRPLDDHVSQMLGVEPACFEIDQTAQIILDTRVLSRLRTTDGRGKSLRWRLPKEAARPWVLVLRRVAGVLAAVGQDSDGNSWLAVVVVNRPDVDGGGKRP